VIKSDPPGNTLLCCNRCCKPCRPAASGQGASFFDPNPFLNDRLESHPERDTNQVSPHPSKTLAPLSYLAKVSSLLVPPELRFLSSRIPSPPVLTTDHLSQGSYLHFRQPFTRLMFPPPPFFLFFSKPMPNLRIVQRPPYAGGPLPLPRFVLEFLPNCPPISVIPFVFRLHRSPLDFPRKKTHRDLPPPSHKKRHALQLQIKLALD